MSEPRPSTRLTLRLPEFIALIASISAINALGIDIMLPALPAMADALHIAVENQRQLIISAYVLGFGSMQLVYGPLTDRYGRKPILLITLALFVVASLAATLVTDFHGIIIARLIQGMAAASTRVLFVSIVRDCFSGRQMARINSLSFIVFLAVPIVAPTLGQFILYAGPWPWIFYVLAGYGALLALWAGFRLPETLPPELRRRISATNLIAAARSTLTTPSSIGYTVASALLFGGLMGFINSVQQIFEHTFQRVDIFTYVFAAVAAAMGVAAWLNSRIVVRLGTRHVSHCALLGFVLVALLHVLVVLADMETIWTFSIFQAATMGCFALAASNFNAMAMEAMGAIAGTAAAIQGTVSTIGGALAGVAIGQSYDGTTLPVAAGYLILGLTALVVVLLTERGRLFRPHAAPVPASAQ